MGKGGRGGGTDARSGERGTDALKLKSLGFVAKSKVGSFQGLCWSLEKAGFKKNLKSINLF